MKTGDLIPYERNPRNNKDAIDKVAESIRAFGFKVPIVIDGNNVIVAGHTRWLAAKRLNLKSVPCIKADDLTPEQVQAFRLADNRVAEFSKWDKKLLKQELKALSELNFDMSAFGFGNDDIREVVEDDYIEEIPETPKSQRGDIYQLGIHRVVCGDSTNADDMALLMGGEQADLILTDPPYNVNYEGGALKKRHKIANDNLSPEDFTVFLSETFRNGYASLKDGGSLYSFCATKSWDSFRRSLENSGFTYQQMIVWVKNAIVLGRSPYQHMFEPILFCRKGEKSTSWFGNRKQKDVIENIDLMDEYQLRMFVKDQWEGTDVIKANKPNASKLHPTMKPIKLLEIMVRNSSLEGDTVLDLFGGSGSTLVTCEQMKRKSLTIEIDPAFVDVIIDRWERFTGRKAEKL